ncbi:MAG: S16 family serine protease [Acidimicrobiales bacterium]
MANGPLLALDRGAEGLPPRPATAGTTLWLRPQWWLAAFSVVVVLANIDIALVEILPARFAAATTVAAVVFLVLAGCLLRRRLGVRTGPGGIELAPLVGRRRRYGWDAIGEAIVRTEPSGRTLVLLRAHPRHGALVELREVQVAGSIDALVAELDRAGVAVRVQSGPGGRLPRLRRNLRRAEKVVVASVAVVSVLCLPLPDRYENSPGTVEPAGLSIAPSQQGHVAGGVRLVTVRTGPANVLTLLASLRDPAVHIGTRTELRGAAPRAAAAETMRQTTAAAAIEAVVAAWRWTGVPVAIEADGVEVVAVPPSLRNLLHAEDVVEAVAGRPTPNQWEFETADGATRGRPVRLAVRRGERHVEIVAPPDWAHPADGGLFLAPAEVRISGAPTAIEIDAGRISGRSAGLAWALALVQRIAGVDLGSGDLVVVTGALSADGTVHDVGAIAQKAAAATRAGATVFVVPADQVEEVEDHVGPDVTVVGVRTLAEAVDFLRGPDEPMARSLVTRRLHR